MKISTINTMWGYLLLWQPENWHHDVKDARTGAKLSSTGKVPVVIFAG
jgi:hypothetical protein